MQKLPHWNNSTPSQPLSPPEQFLWLHSVAQINCNSLSASVPIISYSCVKNSSLLLFQSFPTLFLHQFDVVSSLHWCRYCQNHTRWRGSYNQKSRSHSKWVLTILYLCPPWHLFICIWLSYNHVLFITFTSLFGDYPPFQNIHFSSE